MTLGTTLAETIKEEHAFSKLSAERYAAHTKGQDGVAHVLAFADEIEAIKLELVRLIDGHVPSADVFVALSGTSFHVLSMLSQSIIKPNDANADPMEVLMRNPLYGFGARSLRQWANAEQLEVSWRPRSDETSSWWCVFVVPAPSTIRSR